MADPTRIYHLTTEADLRAGLDGDRYAPPDLADAGFVHCALEASVVPVADDYFASAPGDVLVLEIDPARLSAETRYEAAAPLEGGGRAHLESAPVFPHVYGAIDVQAITGVGALARDAGGFGWPSAFAPFDRFVRDG